MYHDRTRVRDIPKRIYLNEHEIAEIEQAAHDSGREFAAYVRDAALVVSRFIRGQRNHAHQSDLLHQVQVNLAASAANDPDVDPRLSLAA